MNRVTNRLMGLLLPAALILSFLSVLSFSYMPLSASVSPNVPVTLDYNQGSFNFSAIASGGIPFGPQNNSYVYSWTVQKNTTCPGFSTYYPHQRSSLLYLPNGTTTNCVFRLQVADNTGNTTSAYTSNITVNAPLSSLHPLNKTAYTIYQGQNVIISIGGPNGGTPPYHYQWYASTALATVPSSAVANSLCLLSNNQLNCTFNTNSMTAPGIYGFQLDYWDSSTSPAVQTSNSVIVRVGASASQTGTTSSIPTTSASTTVSTTVITTSLPTTVTTTILQVPTTPLTQAKAVVSATDKLVESWIKKLIGYIV
jgi:hypothetical protein